MVYINKDSVDIAFSLDEYVEFVHNEVDVYDFQSLIDTSWGLRALANDRTFLLEAYHEELKRHWVGDTQDSLTPQSIRLHNETDFYIRSNVWPGQTLGTAAEDSMIYSYDLPHNHNFHFCSVGYFGPGYRTDLFRIEGDLPLGFYGESVDLTAQGVFQLEPGTRMVYEAFRDVHTQIPPKTVSISVNLMCRNPEIRSSPQYLFDTERNIVSGSVGTAAQARLYIMGLLRYIGDENSPDVLTEIAKDHFCFRTQALALQILFEQDPVLAEQLWGRASANVRMLAKQDIAVGDEVRQHGLARKA